MLLLVCRVQSSDRTPPKFSINPLSAVGITEPDSMSDAHPWLTMLEALLRSDWVQGWVVHRPDNQNCQQGRSMDNRRQTRLTINVVCDRLYDAVRGAGRAASAVIDRCQTSIAPLGSNATHIETRLSTWAQDANDEVKRRGRACWQVELSPAKANPSQTSASLTTTRLRRP